MKLQESIDRIRLLLAEESTSKYPQLKNDAEALSRLKSAEENLEKIKESSLDKGELFVPQELADLLDKKHVITPKTAIAIYRAVDDWREERDRGGKAERDIEGKRKSKKSIRKNPLFWVVFVLFIAMLIFSLVIAFVPEETIPQWVVFVFSPVGAVGTCLPIALSLREWWSDRKYEEKESKTQGRTSSDISVRIDDHSKHIQDDHSTTTFVNGNVHMNRGLWILAVVAMVCVAIVAIVAIMFPANREKSSTALNPSGTTTGSQQEDSPAKNSVIEYDGFDVIINEGGETVTVSINTQKEGTEIEFPSKILHEGKEYRVTAVGRAGLTNNDKIQSVNLSTSIERIESGAFANFSALKDIFLPNSLTYIGQNAFLGCANLKTVNADDLKSWCKITFEGENSNPLSLNCDSVLTIAGKAITGEPIIEGIEIIPAYTFRNTDIFQVTFESGVTAIGTNAFFNCTQLVTVWDKCALNIKKGSTVNGYVGYYAEHIYSVDSETGRIATDDGFLFDESGTPSLVGYSGNAETLVLPTTAPHGSPYGIAEDVFRGHANITNAVIPNGVISIGEATFSGCSGLTSIVIPDSVITIGYDAFGGCSRLTEIRIPFIGQSKNGSQNAYFGYIFGGSGTAYYKEYVPVSLKKVTITGGASIAEHAFEGCEGLTSVEIPNSVISIGDYAFWECSGLTSVTIGNGVTSIGDYAFDGCEGLTSIEIPNSVTSIGNCAFYECSGLGNVYFRTESKLSSIGNSAFKDCSGLTYVTLPNSVTSIGAYVFNGCSSLTIYIVGGTGGTEKNGWNKYWNPEKRPVIWMIAD